MADSREQKFWQPTDLKENETLPPPSAALVAPSWEKFRSLYFPHFPIHNQSCSTLLVQTVAKGASEDLCGTQEWVEADGLLWYKPCLAGAGTVHFCLESRSPPPAPMRSRKLGKVLAMEQALGVAFIQIEEAWLAHGPFSALTASHRPLNFLFI